VPAEATAAAKTGAFEPRPNAGGGNRDNRGPQRHQRNDRGNDRNRDTRPQRQHGKQPFAASASPKKSSGTVDPDSPFAALSQLKERLEKQTQTQEEAI
jgi:ATP-dependent RNA helicase SUPV3L1/SUV3